MDFKELIFVSGKGGTGKSTVALLLACDLSKQGKKVLLVELAKRSSARALAELPGSPQYKPQSSGLGFDWCLLQGLDCLTEYIASVIKVEKLAQKFFENPMMKTLLNVAPGLNDLSVLGKLTSGLRKHGPVFEYDHIIVDAHSTGSFFSLLNAPEILGKSVSSGPLKTQSESITAALKNEKFVQYFLVSLFEELPMDELEDTLIRFRENYSNQTHVVMNKRFPINSSESDEKSWKVFVNKKNQEKLKQADRASKLWPSCLAVDLITEPFADYVRNNSGEFLRQPLID